MELLQNPREFGDLRLVNIKAKQDSLKIQWIFHCLEQTILLEIFANQVAPTLGQFIWKCNLHYKDIRSMNISNKFWEQVLIAWCKYNFFQPELSEDIRAQILWANSLIQCNYKPIFESSCMQAGSKTIQDILFEDQFMSFEKIRQTYGQHVNWLDYYTLICSIPPEWKLLLGNQQLTEHYQYKYDMLLRCPNCTQVVYSKLVTKPSLIDKYVAKWESILGIIVDTQEFLKYIIGAYQCTVSTKYSNFQYNYF